MKTATITLHSSDNCGSTLQAYALQKFLLDNNIDNIIIDYDPPIYRSNGKGLRKIVKNIFFRKSIKSQKIKDREFRNKCLILSEMYIDAKDLVQNPPIADCYISGSDQLWNTMYPCGNDPMFYLSFTEKKKIAYAISAGRKEIPQDNLNIIGKYIADFNMISVREKNSVHQLKKLVPEKEIFYVCDPVLLNKKDIYKKVQADRMIRGKYIFIYVAQQIDTKLLKERVEMLKNKFNSVVVFAGAFVSKCKCDVHIRDMSPDEFLSLICHAEYIVSNSFHATLFSIIYHKQFEVYAPKDNGIRIIDILDTFDLKSHIMEDATDMPQIISDCEFEKIDVAVEDFRNRSSKLLLNEIFER